MSNASACAVLGVLFLIGGFFAYFYYVTYGYKNPLSGEYMYTWNEYPYRDLGTPLIVLGVALIVVGAVLSSIKKTKAETTEKRIVLVPLKKCPKCGIKYRGHEYCPICGTKLEPTQAS